MLKVIAALLVCFAANSANAANVSSKTVDTQLQNSLAAFFAAKPSAHGAIAKLKSITHWPNIKGKARWSLPKLRFLPKRVSLIAEQGYGKSLRRWYVSANIKWMRQVVVLNKDISARSMLDKSMLTKKWKNIAGLRGQTWSNIHDVIGLKTLRNMRRDDVIISTVVKRPPLIKRGDRVTILVELNGIKVRAEGIALKSGSQGDRMLVQNISSKQTLHSIIKDAHTVSIPMGGV